MAPRTNTQAAVLEDDTTKKEQTPPDTTAPAKEENDSQKKNRLRNEAEREVLANHREEFYTLAEKKFSENGLVFQRRLSDSEKAQKKIQELLAAHPELRDSLSEKKGDDQA